LTRNFLRPPTARKPGRIRKDRNGARAAKVVIGLGPTIRFG
jgi:hypothetical protein